MAAKALVPRRAIDVPTVVIAAVLVGGLVANATGAAQGLLPLPLAFLISAVLMNCSFTVWHEAMHGNLAPGRRLNDVLGVIAAWISLTPYFRIREVHRQHHAYTNDPARDPDYWYVAGPMWTLPFRYVAGFRRYARVQVSAAGRVVDALGVAFAVGVIVTAYAMGQTAVLIATWLAPKVVSFAAHAWYVNYLPHHHEPTGRFTSARVVERVWWEPLVLFHNYHGLHHAYQTIPWHRYRVEFEQRRAFLVAQGMPVTTGVREPVVPAGEAAR
jgi:fatty acid desaturase